MRNTISLLHLTFSKLHVYLVNKVMPYGILRLMPKCDFDIQCLWHLHFYFVFTTILLSIIKKLHFLHINCLSYYIMHIHISKNESNFYSFHMISSKLGQFTHFVNHLSLWFIMSKLSQPFISYNMSNNNFHSLVRIKQVCLSSFAVYMWKIGVACQIDV